MKHVVRMPLVINLLLLLLSSTVTVAQGPSPRDPALEIRRPRIGIALDAGGALGLAHVGVLQWMEERRIPVDYVAGTSMGGLVGGAYATGMRASEMRVMVSKIDWSTTVYSGEADYRDLPFHRKLDRMAYPNGLEVGLNHGLQIPTGLNSGQNVDRMISGFALAYSNVQNFDDLPIPFRCVGTDLNSGTEYVFSSGVLGDALRATMSIPGVFEPVSIGDKLFVDGTIINPLPTDVTREMGADVVIGVYLLSYAPNVKPASPVGVLMRAIQAVTLQMEQKNMPGANVLITVPLLDLDNMQYEKWEAIMARGYAEAERNSAALLKYALPQEEWDLYLSRRDARKRSLSNIQRVTLNGDTQLAAAEGLQSNSRGSVDAASVNSAVGVLSAQGKFARVRPQLTADADNTLALDFQAVKKEYGNAVLQPLLLMDGAQYNDLRASVGGRLILRNASGSETRTDVLVGSTYQIASEYLWPVLGSRHLFVATHAQAENSPLDFYSSGGKYAAYRQLESSGGFDLGYTVNRYAEVRAGYSIGYTKYSHDLGPSLMDPVWDGTQKIANFRLTVDHTDDAVIPQRGYGAEALFAYYHQRPGAAEAFPSLQLRLRAFQPLGERSSVFAIGSVGSTLGYRNTGFPLYGLGSTTRLAAYGPNEIRTDQYWLAQTGYLYKLMAMPPMAGKNVYLTTAFEIAKPFYVEGMSQWPMDGKIGVVAQTLLGPISLGTAIGDGGHRKFYIQFGRVF